MVAEADAGEELEVLVADEADAAAAASKGNFLMATSKEIMGTILIELGRRYHSGRTFRLSNCEPTQVYTNKHALRQMHERYMLNWLVAGDKEM